ncbi:MAG: cbb3-type cytochrome c oxidase subunit II [Chthoniobacterales bacterium]
MLPLILGIFGTFAFSWAGLTLIPNAQIGHLDPQTDEEGLDAYPAPKSGLAVRGQQVYAANGCVYCHSQQVRADYAGSDIERKWGERRSAPRDYLFERPVLLGKSRLGPDLANIGKRSAVEEPEAAAAPAAAQPAPAGAGASAQPTANASAPATDVRPEGGPAPAPGAPPAASPAPVAAVAAAAPNTAAPVTTVNGEPALYSTAWHHRHLYDPRSFVKHSNMPAYRFLYEKRRIGGEPSADALQLTGDDAPLEGWEIVPTYEAKSLVAYLMSLDQSHPLKEVKNTTVAAPAASPAAAPPTEGAAK